MDKVERSHLNIEEIVNRVFCDLTMQMLALKMHKKESFEPLVLEKNCFEIRTEGAFQSLILFEMEERVYDRIAIILHKNEMLTTQEKKIYVIEYLNVICGRILSEINNKLGKRSKLSVPIRINQCVESQCFENRMDVSYTCLDGCLDIKVCFDIEA